MSIETKDKPTPRGIAIVAFGATKTFYNWASPLWTAWSMNDSYHYFAQKLSALFEMHPIAHYTDPRYYFADHEAEMARLAENIKVYLAFPNPKIPAGVMFPLAEIVKEFGRSYFTSSITYMIPLAIMTIEQSIKNGDGLYAPRLGLWGCDMQLTSEYAKERACTEYWLGRAEQRGIEIVVPDESPLLKGGYLYGYEQVEITNRQRVIDARRKELTEMLRQAHEADRAANDRVSSIQAMLDESSYYEANLTDALPTGQSFK